MKSVVFHQLLIFLSILTISVWSRIIKVDFKKNSDLLVDKTYEDYSSDNTNSFRCQIKLKWKSSDTILVRVVDEIKLKASIRVQSQIPYSENKDILSFTTNISDTYTKEFNYTFILRQSDDKEVSKTLIYNLKNNDIIGQSETCSRKGNFNENVEKFPGLFLGLLFLGLILSGVVLAVIIIIYICCIKRCTEAVKEPKMNRNRYKLIEDESVNNNMHFSESNAVYYEDVITECQTQSDLEIDLMEVDRTYSLLIDDYFMKMFKTIWRSSFDIWLKQLSQKYSGETLIDKIRQCQNECYSDEDTIMKKFDESLKKSQQTLIKKIISRTKKKFNHLKKTQEEQLEIALAGIIDEEKKGTITNKMEELFSKEVDELSRKLKMKQDEDFEKEKFDLFKKCATEIKAHYHEKVIRMIETMEINNNEKIEIKSEFNKMQLEFQKLKISELLRENLHFEINHQKRKNMGLNQIKLLADNEEVLLRKKRFVEDQLRENAEYLLDKRAEEIRKKFEEDQDNIIKKNEKDKSDQMGNLRKRLKEQRNKKMEQLKIEQENDLNNLISSCTSETELKVFLNTVSEILIAHNRRRKEAEEQLDKNVTTEVENLTKEISSQTEEEVDTLIVNLFRGLVKDEFQDDEIDDILNKYQKLHNKLKDTQEQERNKQKEQLNKKMEQVLRKREEDTSEQIVNENKKLASEMELMSEVITMQKVLSSDERDKILKEFNANKSSIEKGLALLRIEQHQKLADVIAARKKKQHINLEKEFNNLVNEMRNRYQNMTDEDILYEARLKVLDNVLVNISQESSEEFDKEIESIQDIIMKEREEVLRKEQEETTEYLNKLQMEKANAEIEMKQEQESLDKLLIIAAEIAPQANAEDIIKTMKINSSTIQKKKEQEYLKAEEAIRKKRMKTLLNTTDEQLDETDNSIINKQSEEHEMRMREMKEYEEKKKEKMEKLKRLLNNGEIDRDDLVKILLETDPLMTEEELEKKIQDLQITSGDGNKTKTNDQHKPKYSLKHAYERIKSAQKPSLQKENSIFSVYLNYKKQNEAKKNDVEFQNLSFTNESYSEPKKSRKKKKHRRNRDEQLPNENESDF